MALIPGTLPTGTKYPNDPQTLLDTFASYMTAPEAKKNRPVVMANAPASGGTVTFNVNSQDETVFLDIPSAITGLSVVFPSDANSVVGQTLRIFAANAVNATVSYTNGVREPAGPTSFAADTMYSWQKVKANTWAGSYSTLSTISTLTRYETGSFTPTVSAGFTSPTYGANTSGAYTRIGNMVFYYVRVELSGGTATTSRVQIAGLPFAAVAGRFYASQDLYLNSGAAGGQNLVAIVTSTNIDLYTQGTAALTAGSLAGNTVGNTMEILINGSYATAAA